MAFLDIIDSYFDKLSNRSGFDVLYNYLSNHPKDKQLIFDNTNPEYRHSRVTIETRHDLLFILITLPSKHEKTNEIISIKLKENNETADVSIRISLDKVFYGYLDLNAYRIQIEDCNASYWEIEEYEKYILDGLLFLESSLKEKIKVSLTDLGFIHLNFYSD